MKRRVWFLVVLSLVLVVALAACNSSDEPATSQPATTGGDGGGEGAGGNTETATPSEPSGGDDPVELTFWILGEPGYDDGLIQEWNEQNPDIQVTFQKTADQAAHHNNMLTALTGGAGAPDIFMLEIAFVERFINATDQFYNLYDLGAESIRGDYLEWKWLQAASPDDSFLIGLPTDIGPTVAYYRADLIEQAGFPSDPEEFGALIDTWDKFADVAREFTAKTGIPFVDTTDLLFNGFRDQSDGFIYYNHDNEFIGHENPQVVRGYDYTAQGIQEGWILNVSLWTPEWTQAMNDGGFAVILAPAWMQGYMKGNAPDGAGHWRVTQMPEGAGNWGGSFLTLPAQGKHPEEAYKFISWLVNRDNQLRVFESHGLMPSIPSLYNDDTFVNFTDDFFGGQATATAFGEAALRVKPVYYGPLHDATDSLIKDALQNVIETGADPEAEWEKFVDQAQTLARRGE